MASVFAASRSKTSPLVIGSIKSNIGHSEPAAGVSGLIKAALAVEKGRIPGNPTFIDPNPNIDFEGSRVAATRYTIPWPVSAPVTATNGHGGVRLRRASINSFGYGGSNAHVIVDQVPEELQSFTSSFGQGLDDLLDDDAEDDAAVSRPHVLLFSANDEGSIRAYTESLRKHLLNPRVSVSLPDLAYTLSERRTRHFHRGYVVTKDLSLDPNSIIYGKQRPESPRVGFIFTGQGAQWSQMGRSLVDNFSEARDTIERLDSALRELVHPPAWSLIQELTEARSPEKLREPEFSQPLVTALQIAIVNVLRRWGIRAEAAVGHSSGEIAAAYAAGLLSESSAIKAAYYRGYAAKKTAVGEVEAQSTGKPYSAVGMMAVGLGADRVQPYITTTDVGAKVSIACFNSPDSVTLSGTIKSLETVRTALVADGHFARMLQVNMAYHSPFMADAGDEYVRCLEAEAFSTTAATRDVNGGETGETDTKMFSSVEGDYTTRPVDIGYWKSNMVQPVLFEQALKQMLSRKDSPDFLIEIGPSGALAGPTNQVKKSLPGGGANVQYCAALSRGRDAERAIFDVAGRLFVAGHTAIDFTAVNNPDTQKQTPSPKVIVDLPNYAWNHNAEYWYESEASQDWRNRRFPHHDLLGSKVLGTAWQAPTWKKSLKLEDLPWLRDHRLGPEVVFPGAGYMCMAIEAMLQTDEVLRTDDAQIGPGADSKGSEQQVRLRNVTFDRALVLEEGKETRIMLTLAPFTGQRDGWYNWVVRSLVQGSWLDHCKGQVRVEKDVNIVASPSDVAPLQHPVPGALWYKPMSDAGYNFGKSFQKLQQAETTSGSRRCRSHVELVPPPSAYPQSEYPIHPAAFDGCMQSCAPGLWAGVKSSVNAVLVPAIIDDIVVRTGAHHELGISVSESLFAGPGRKDLAKNYSSNAKVYDPKTGELIFKLTGLRYHMLDFQDTPYAAHLYSRLVWEPDVTLSPQACATNRQIRGWDKVQEIADLFAHKKPNAKVVEASLVPGDSSSVWLENIVSSSESKARNAFGSYSLLTNDAPAAVAAQGRYESVPRTEFQLLDVSQVLVPSDDDALKEVDLFILRLPSSSSHGNIDATVVENVGNIVRGDGHILILEQSGAWEVDHASSNGEVIANGVNGNGLNGVKPNATPFEAKQIDGTGFELLYTIDCDGSPSLSHGYLAKILPASGTDETQYTTPSPLDIVHITQPGPIGSRIIKALAGRGWDIQEIEIVASGLPRLDKIRKDATVLVLSEVDAPQLPTLSTEQWAAVQQLLQLRNRIMWVSKSAQWEVQNPDGAMIHGLCRSVRTEDPTVTITTLDLEDPTNDAAVPSIDLLLRATAGQDSSTGRTGGFEGEYVERRGILHVSRILGDDAINATEQAKILGAQPVERRLHEAPTTIRLIAERVGSIDSLQYVEVDANELPLPDNTVEVELFASALNFKDVAVTMGLVPEDQHLLGLEGGGVIRRTGERLNSPFSVGQRVLVFKKGTFANRVIATTERTIAIPDWLSYEDAATLPSVYLTSLYSLFNLSGIKKGDRVLIHSATGGLGVASIQICQSVGAEVYATVGQDVKKQFLIDNFGIPGDHIFNSRTIEFQEQIMDQTSGYGVDIILNSLTGDLLDASWRCIAEGGTMVELGKKDHLDRNTLAMEPFARNASYRCFDMSHECVTDQVIAV